MRCAISWKKVLVVRPQPGQARHLRAERAQAQRLQHLLRHQHLLGAIATRRRRQRDADGVADALVEQDRQAGRGGDDALHAHARLGQPQVQRVVAATRQRAIDVDQVAHAADLGAEDDAVVRQTGRLGQLGGAQGRLQHGLDHHLARLDRCRRARVGVHQLGQQVLIERAPVDADAHRLVVLDGDAHDGGEVLVAALGADVARG